LAEVDVVKNSLFIGYNELIYEMEPTFTIENNYIKVSAEINIESTKIRTNVSVTETNLWYNESPMTIFFR